MHISETIYTNAAKFVMLILLIKGASRIEVLSTNIIFFCAKETENRKSTRSFYPKKAVNFSSFGQQKIPIPQLFYPGYATVVLVTSTNFEGNQYYARLVC